MMCELCGQNTSEAYRVRLEGGEVTACRMCSKHGEVLEKAGPKKKPKPRTQKKPPQKKGFELEAEYDIAEDYANLIRKAREKRKLTQEELARQVNETESAIHRMEQGRLEPTIEFAKKLEKKLAVKLLLAHKDDEEPMNSTQSKEFTLGDLVVVREKKK